MDLFVALVAGAIGALVAGLFQIRGRRLEQLRERQINAADEFAAAAADVFSNITQGMIDLSRVGDSREWMDGFRQAGNDAYRNVNKLTRLGPRVSLLFGVTSPTTLAAREVVTHLRRMSSALGETSTTTAELVAERLRLDAPLSDEAHGGGLPATREYYLASEALDRFSQRASRVVTWPIWRQRLGWMAEEDVPDHRHWQVDR